ncbi:tubulin-tyrosine ligase family domain-containing protein [Phthorimaea operculella]|nr:tubulin-tyrosine ligase family domain-containing protein [Phthorimaea operculella]
MESELDDAFLRDEEQESSEPSSRQVFTVPYKRKNHRSQDERSPEPKEPADHLATMIRSYDGKMEAEDDATSQPTSRTAPFIPMETRKKKKRRRSQISICLTNCRYESIRKVASAFGMRETSEEDAWNFYWTDMSVSVERAKEMKRSEITICLTNCAYKSIRNVASAFGMREVSKEDPWNFYWTDMSVNVEKAKEMKRFQRINHFPGMLEICRKDLLARNLNRMQKIYPKEYNFFPKTWCFPADFGEALNYSKSRKNKTFIIKPECGSQGRGIYLTKSLKDIKPTDKLICQVYLAKPYLVDGYKFDIRVYTLITSCDPLRIFVYNEGLVRYKPYLVDGYKFDIRVYTLITSCDPLRIFVYNEGLVSTFFVPAYLSLNATEALLADQASLRIFVYNEGLVRYKPYLVDGYKFDIHVYTLITSCDPLRIFVYNEGLVSFPRPSLSSLTSSSKCSAWTTLTNEHRAAFRSAGERTGAKFRSA